MFNSRPQFRLTPGHEAKFGTGHVQGCDPTCRFHRRPAALRGFGPGDDRRLTLSNRTALCAHSRRRTRQPKLDASTSPPHQRRVQASRCRVRASPSGLDHDAHRDGGGWLRALASSRRRVARQRHASCPTRAGIHSLGATPTVRTPWDGNRMMSPRPQSISES